MNAQKLDLLNAVDFILHIEEGPDAGKAFRIRPPKILVGRDPEKCQIILSDSKVSRQQCVIQFNDHITCIDVSTRKTTAVNGHIISERIIAPGDIISFGHTKIKFLTRTNENAKPQLESIKKSPEQAEKEQGRKKFRLYIIVIAFLAIALNFLQQKSPTAPAEKLITQEEINKQVEESKERTSLIKESHKNSQRHTDKNYIYNVETHFISGFRDFQNGQYSRALESFGTTIATDQQHKRAQQYARSARKKKAELIDTHLRDGVKYKEKMMYSRCAAEFEKAIVYINNINSKKYLLARSQLEECRLLKAGGPL